MQKNIFWLLLIVFFVLFSLVPTFYEVSFREKLQGRSFELVHNYITDYHFYLSRIRQGAEGRWSVIEQYTSEPHRGSYVQVFYLLLGKPVGFMSDKAYASQLAYHLSRGVLGLFLLGSIVWVVRKSFSSFLFQILAFFTIVTASTWPKVVVVHGVYRFGGYMAWWTLMDSLQRITFLPHLLIGQFLLVILLVVGCGRVYTEKPWQWILWGGVALLLGMIFPPGLVFVGVCYGIVSIIEILSDTKRLIIAKKRDEWIYTSILPKFCIGVVSIPSLLYFKLLFIDYPWKRLVELDVLHPLPFQFTEYIQALGPTLPLGILGLLLVFIRKEKKLYWVNAWVITWIVLLWVFQFIPEQLPLRFSEMVPHIPLGILTAYLFYQAFLFVQRFFKKQPKYLVSGIWYLVWKIGKSVSYIILNTLYLILLSLGLGVMASSIFWQKDFIDQKVGAGYPAISMNNYIVYPLQGFMDGISYIEKNTPRNTVILSLLTAGNYIPPFAGRTVYVGHDNTVDGDTKLARAKQFFRGDMKKEDALMWLKETGITYIFFGPQEKEEGKMSELHTRYPFLQKMFQNTDVTIYQW